MWSDRICNRKEGRSRGIHSTQRRKDLCRNVSCISYVERVEMKGSSTSQILLLDREGASGRLNRNFATELNGISESALCDPNPVTCEAVLTQDSREFFKEPGRHRRSVRRLGAS